MTNGNKQISTYLSKSLFLRGLQCHKSLYLQKYHPESKDDLPESRISLLHSGVEVGLFARQIFPDGTEILYDNLSFDEKLEMTRHEIESGAHVLYEAAFSHENVFIKADILQRNNTGWELYEVKSGTNFKDQHLHDIAIQYYVIKNAGYPISKASLIYINNQYVRNGDIEIDRLFRCEDVTDKVKEKQGFVEDSLKNMRAMLSGDIPGIDIGEHCKEPSQCDFKGYCWQHVSEDSVLHLRGKKFNSFDFYRRGMTRLRDIPLETLRKDQRIQAEAFLQKKEHIDKEAIKRFLDSLWYPLYFLDFETINPAIPLFDGTHPYKEVPFQYSLHYMENENAELRHLEFLTEPGIDPRLELLRTLLSEIPDNSCLVVYTHYEKKIMNLLASWFPEYQDQIKKRIDNMRDLALPFQRKDFYHWQLKGSASLKDVLPLLVPELSYQSMEISDGMMAMDAYREMCQITYLERKENVRKALLEYCKLDTLAMVKILEKLRQMI